MAKKKSAGVAVAVLPEKKAIKEGASGKVMGQSSSHQTKPKRPYTDIQKALDALVFKHGENLQNWGNYADLLTEAGIQRKEVTDTMYGKSVKRARKQTKEKTDAPLPQSDELVWQGPSEGEWDTCTWHCWKTLCERYRIMRVIQRSEAHPNYFGCSRGRMKDGKRVSWEVLDPAKDGYAKRHRTLRTAMEACELYHLEKTGQAIKSNLDDMVIQAGKLGLNELPAQVATNGDVTHVPVSTPKVKTPREPRVAGDSFLGSHPGSQAYAINKAFVEGITTVERLVEKTGLPYNRVSGHMGLMVKKGRAVKTGETSYEIADGWNHVG